ncbi:hypothetical protein [Lysobacter gummosus]|uniref:hypothetical protein n=1 Tax=Lysobacter gummosus TaxID=262324 RepID=UPI0036293C39
MRVGRPAPRSRRRGEPPESRPAAAHAISRHPTPIKPAARPASPPRSRGRETFPACPWRVPVSPCRAGDRRPRTEHGKDALDDGNGRSAPRASRRFRDLFPAATGLVHRQHRRARCHLLERKNAIRE